MKKLITILFVMAAVAANSQEVRFRISNNDPVSGKRIIAFLTNAPLGRDGTPLFIQYLVTLKEVDEVTDAIPSGTTKRAKRAVESYEETFVIDDRKIHGTTLLYLPENTTNPNAITLKEYFRTRTINDFPGVSGGDPARDFAEGLLRQMILIRQANGELPN